MNAIMGMPALVLGENLSPIRKLAGPKKARLPIVTMMAHAMKGDREKCLAAGLDGYVSKPIQPEELIRAVERYSENNVG